MSETHFFHDLIAVMEIAALVFAGFVVLLAVVLVALNRRNHSRRRHRARLTERWRAYFIDAAAHPSGNGAPVDNAARPAALTVDADRYEVLLLFVRMYSEYEQSPAYRAERQQAMVKAARRAGLEGFAMHLLRTGDDIDRVAAFHALGLFGAVAASVEARTQMTNPGTELSRAAAHCLLRLDPLAIDVVLEQVRARPDWERTRVEAMLREVGPGTIDPALSATVARATDSGDSASAARLLSFTRCCSPDIARGICHRTLASAGDPELRAAALRALGEVAAPEDVVVAREYATNPDAYVRLGALRVLRKVATPGDVHMLLAMTSDLNAWVRRRAAQVLVTIGDTTTPAGQTAGMAAHPDPYARDAIAEAAAATRFARRTDEAPRRPTPHDTPESR